MSRKPKGVKIRSLESIISVPNQVIRRVRGAKYIITTGLGVYAKDDGTLQIRKNSGRALKRIGVIDSISLEQPNQVRIFMPNI